MDIENERTAVISLDNAAGERAVEVEVDLAVAVGERVGYDVGVAVLDVGGAGGEGAQGGWVKGSGISETRAEREDEREECESQDEVC